MVLKPCSSSEYQQLIMVPLRNPHARTSPRRAVGVRPPCACQRHREHAYHASSPMRWHIAGEIRAPWGVSHPRRLFWDKPYTAGWRRPVHLVDATLAKKFAVLVHRLVSSCPTRPGTKFRRFCKKPTWQTPGLSSAWAVPSLAEGGPKAHESRLDAPHRTWAEHGSSTRGR